MNYHPKWPFEILPPSRNLGCLAVRVLGLYMDVFRRGNYSIGIFWSYRSAQGYLLKRGWLC